MWDRTRVVAVCAATGVVASAFAYWKVRGYFNRKLKEKEIMRHYSSNLYLDNQILLKLKNEFLEHMDVGLATAGPVGPGRRLLMLPSHIARLPDGHESGSVYAIDMGGTNFRVMHIRLSAESGKIEYQNTQEASIPHAAYTGTGTELFDFIARTVASFISAEKKQATPLANGNGAAVKEGGEAQEKEKALPVLGFCFSFAMEQTAVNAGKLLCWTKGFACSGVVGNDPVQLLDAALKRAGCPCRVTALLNDTVGVLAAARYTEPDSCMGIIVGTGTNACYAEKVGRVCKWRGHGLPADAETVINMEWGAFESEALPRLAEDLALDAASTSKGQYPYEKMISGLYIGEIAGRILFRLARDVGLFGGKVPEALLMRDGFTTADLAAIDDDDVDPWLHKTGDVLCTRLGLQPKDVPHSVRMTCQLVCRLVGYRSAKLVAAGIYAVLTRQGFFQLPKRVVIAVEGGVYEKYRHYSQMLEECVWSMVIEDVGLEKAQPLLMHIHFTAVHNGASTGAAVLAAAAARA